MLKIAPQLIAQVRSATKPEDLHGLVQKAVELEHATIPCYLAAYFTLKPGTNPEIAAILKSIVIEEMLHMTIASNLLIALGGAPEIDKKGFVPAYPGTLPMNLGNSVVATLRKCTVTQIHDVFMEIEKPEDVLEFDVLLTAAPPSTIGQFYTALAEKLEELGEPAFKGDFSLEMTDSSWFGPDLFPIVGVESAKRGIEIIKVQGEGTSLSPEDADGELAHYYRFRQIYEGRALIKDPTAKGGWSYSGAPLVVDESGVWDMVDDPKTSDYPPGTKARALVDTFNGVYSDLLRALHRTFNGEPGQIDPAIGLMYDLRLAAQAVLQLPAPSGGGQCGLPFEFSPT